MDNITFELLDGDLSKSLFEKQSDLIVEKSLGAHESPLRMKMKIRAMIETLKLADEKLTQPSLTEALSYGANKITIDNCDIKIAEVGTTYDYGTCPEWVALKSKEDSIVNERKRIEESLRSGSYINESTGKVIHVGKTSKTGLQFWFKK